MRQMQRRGAARHASCENVAVLAPIGLSSASPWEGGKTQPMACGPEPSATAWLREVSMTSAHLANLFPSLARQSNPWKPWNPRNPWNPKPPARGKPSGDDTVHQRTLHRIHTVRWNGLPTRPEAAGMPRRRDAVSAVRNEATEAALIRDVIHDRCWRRPVEHSACVCGSALWRLLACRWALERRRSAWHFC